MNGLKMAGMMLIALAVAAAAGCNRQTENEPSSSSNGPPSPPELAAMTRPPIPDLPVPVGFDLDQKYSRNLAAAGIRWVDHLYKGSPDKFAVARFYRRQMPINRWTLVTEMFSTGSLKLDFEKQNERCHITVSDGSLFNPTYIRVELWTAGRVPQQAVNPLKESER
ncbi:MAG: hypothetical protein ABSH10_08850 [Phycisphaerae bacterium]|jgi:hypothetical protein